MLAEARPDVVHITTPPHTHRPLALQLSRRPERMSTSRNRSPSTPPKPKRSFARPRRVVCASAWATTSCSTRRGRNAGSRVAAGEVGEIVHVEALQGYDLAGPFGRLLQDDPSHWVHRLPGGLFQNVMSHALARILDLIPDEPLAVSRPAGSRPIRRPGFPTELRVLLFGARSTGALTFSSTVRPPRRITRVFGTRCTLDVDLDSRTVSVDRPGSLPGALGKMDLVWRRFAQARRHLTSQSGATRAMRPPLLRRNARAVRALLANLFTAITRTGVLFLWPVRVPAADGRVNEWHVSQATAAEAAMRDWICMKANMSLRAYEISQPENKIPDPEWLEQSFR